MRFIAIVVAALVVQSDLALAKNDWLKQALNEAASNVAADVTMKIDADGLERGLRGPIPDALKKNAAVYDQQILAKYPEVTDEAQVARLKRVVDSLVGQMHNKEHQFTIRLLKSDEVNAFTTGGPYIYVYTALLDQVQDDDELAGILGHELAHVDATHIARSQAQGSWIGLGSFVASRIAKGEDRNKVADGHAAANATFSREYESEADTLGTLFAMRAGYKPRGLVTFFDRCERDQQAQKAQIIEKMNEANAKLAQLKANLDTAARRKQQALLGIDGGAYEQARLAYNDFVPRYNDFMAKAKMALAAPSPWFADHPFDQYRRTRVMTFADYLDKKTPRKDVADAILQKVMATVEKVEGKPI